MKYQIYTIILVITLISCGTRKKTLDKTKVTVENITKKETDTAIVKDVTEGITGTTKAIEVRSDLSATFEGRVADSTKPATIEERVTEGVKTTTFTNFKEVKTSKNNKGESKEVTAKKTTSLVDRSIIDTSVKEVVNSVAVTETKALDVERKSGFPWWILILIGLIIAVYFYWKSKV